MASRERRAHVVNAPFGTADRGRQAPPGGSIEPGGDKSSSHRSMLGLHQHRCSHHISVSAYTF